MRDLLFCIIQDYAFEGAKFDMQTITDRLEAEGISFLTKGLPALYKHVLQCVSAGRYVPYSGFRRRRGSVLPVFLYGALSLIFDDRGILKQGAEVGIAAAKQILYVFYKTEFAFDQGVIEKETRAYVQRDLDLLQTDACLPNLDVASRVVEQLFKGHDLNLNQVRFGPGATESGATARQKWEQARYFPSLDALFPYEWHFALVPERETIPRDKPRTRLLFVPKDSRGPRTISCEPHEYMWFQQGIARWMMSVLKGTPVYFESADRNRELARRGSIDGSFSTVDMNEASDRVSLALVRRVFSRVPKLLSALEATRVPWVQLPDGRLFYMSKFANMGSATCFPVEGVVHYALIRQALHDLGHKTFDEIAVFGDDLIIPGDCDLKEFSDSFRQSGLKVNVLKSYANGQFRESCGHDYYAGHRIDYVKIRRFEDLSLIAAANHFFRNGLHITATKIRELLPHVPSGFCIDNAFHFGPRRGRTRWNKNTCTLQVRSIGISPRYDTCDGMVGLNRSYHGLGRDRSARLIGVRSQSLKTRWFSL